MLDWVADIKSCSENVTSSEGFEENDVISWSSLPDFVVILDDFADDGRIGQSCDVTLKHILPKPRLMSRKQ